LSKLEPLCYAYRDVGSRREEDLAEHLMEVASCCASRWELSALASKMSKALGIGFNTTRDALILAGLLHDIGKAAYVYQKLCSSDKCTDFQGHYLISAFITHLALNLSGTTVDTRDVVEFLSDNYAKLSEDKIFAILMILPIAFHHYHQVRGVRSYDTILRHSVEDFLENPLIHSPCLESFKRVTGYRGVSSARGKDLIRSLYTLLTDIKSRVEQDSYRCSKLFIQMLEELVRKGLRELSITLGKTIIEAVTGVVNLCDGSVASKKRR